MEEAKKRGRPRKEPGEKLVRITLYVHPPVKDRVKLSEDGEEWARTVLARALKRAR